MKGNWISALTQVAQRNQFKKVAQRKNKRHSATIFQQLFSLDFYVSQF